MTQIADPLLILSNIYQNFLKVSVFNSTVLVISKQAKFYAVQLSDKSFSMDAGYQVLLHAIKTGPFQHMQHMDVYMNVWMKTGTQYIY